MSVLKDVGDIQEFFRVSDAGETDRLGEYLHPDIRVILIGVEGVDEPMDKDGYLRFIHENVAYRESRVGGAQVASEAIRARD